jgi:hypothetical protein
VQLCVSARVLRTQLRLDALDAAERGVDAVAHLLLPRAQAGRGGRPAVQRRVYYHRQLVTLRVRLHLQLLEAGEQLLQRRTRLAVVCVRVLPQQVHELQLLLLWLWWACMLCAVW